MRTFARFVFSILKFVPVFLFGAAAASAHEVYVLDAHEVVAAKKEPMLNIAKAVSHNPFEFIIATTVAIVIVVLVYRISTTSKFEKYFDPFYDRLKAWAPFVAQFTLGAALLTCGFNYALFGIELPFSVAFPGAQELGQFIILVLGAMLVCGIFPRIASGCVVFLYIWFSAKIGLYMLNYAMYLGVAIAVMLYGGGLDVLKIEKKGKKLSPKRIKSETERSENQFFIIRVLYGISLIFASLYAKLLFGGLALLTVSKYSLTDYFPFSSEFVVLGALLVEVGLGVCFILGFNSRFAALTALVFLMLSMGVFGEAVWPHIIIIGLGISIFMYGYDRRCLSVVMSKKSKWDPIL